MGWSLLPEFDEGNDWAEDSDDVELHEHPPRVVTREEWGAVEEKAPPQEIEDFPAAYMVFMHTRSRPCRGKEDCSRAVKELQEEWMAKGEDDLPFNFLLDHDGFIYVGRGPKAVCMTYPEDDKKLGPANGKSINIGIIGSGGDEPPEVFIQGAASLSVILFDGKFVDESVKLLWYNIPQEGLIEDPHLNEEQDDLINNQVEASMPRPMKLTDEETREIVEELNQRTGRPSYQRDPLDEYLNPSD